MGALTPIGNTVEEFWSNTKSRKSGIDYITLLDKDELSVKIAGEVKNFNPEEKIGKKESKRLDRYAQFALVCADEAIKSAGLDLENMDMQMLCLQVVLKLQ